MNRLSPFWVWKNSTCEDLSCSQLANRASACSSLITVHVQHHIQHLKTFSTQHLLPACHVDLIILVLFPPPPDSFQVCFYSSSYFEWSWNGCLSRQTLGLLRVRAQNIIIYVACLFWFLFVWTVVARRHLQKFPIEGEKTTTMSCWGV